jgi:hypothetical protein
VAQGVRDIGLRTTSWPSSCIHSDEDASMSRAEWERAKARKMESGSLSTYPTYCSSCLFGESSKLEKLRPDVLATRA